MKFKVLLLFVCSLLLFQDNRGILKKKHIRRNENKRAVQVLERMMSLQRERRQQENSKDSSLYREDLPNGNLFLQHPGARIHRLVGRYNFSKRNEKKALLSNAVDKLAGNSSVKVILNVFTPVLPEKTGVAESFMGLLPGLLSGIQKLNGVVVIWISQPSENKPHDKLLADLAKNKSVPLLLQLYGNQNSRDLHTEQLRFLLRYGSSMMGLCLICGMQC
mmetsp:Transcript_31354/g.87945  ORF Transcript_31354/g.87945 Transcript_31354/m.87945 type:complete len:219 (-) Transcript_31354:1714-2370(-)